MEFFPQKKKTKLKIYISKNILHFLGFKNCDFVEVISRCSRLIGTRWLFLLLCLVKRSAKLTLYFGFCPIISIFRRNRQVLQKFANIASLGLKIADFRRLAIYRQAQILIASSMSKIADLAIYRQKWQHWTTGNNIIEFKKIQLDGNRWLFWCSGFMPVLFSDNAGTKACIGSWKNLFKAQLSMLYLINFVIIWNIL